MALRHVLLVALHRTAATGYEVTRRFDSTLGHFWKASHQQVYRELARLEAEGLVAFREIAQKGRPDKKRYRLTAKGQRELERWLDEPPPERRVNDELLVKILGGEIVGAETLRAHINTKRLETEQRLDVLLGIEQEYRKGPPLEKLAIERRLLYLTLRKGIAMARANIEWALEAQALLEGGKIV